MSEDTNKETNVADTLNEIFDDDPAKKAREREIAKYEKKRQKALEKETRKAAKAEAKQKKKNGESEENTEVSQLGTDKSAEGQASGVSGWSWDQAVKESSETRLRLIRIRIIMNPVNLQRRQIRMNLRKTRIKQIHRARMSPMYRPYILRMVSLMRKR